ncbi:DUF3150 domain-containing protein [Pseudomonas mosselii]|uniref:DUF3150 domain-containing protein n=1 Tax=Pseudomonas mosselii TaxID=78327 RepID=UPI0021D9BCCB|nr:DUF3150 domain-containing protein [Pseudomonas mosselii]MCU9528549.1 DUF3150 domain-containing protein [Pseudomonas mosselii]MCU9535883.1 DUF3150 domain-containing protein [Pseudomonas mosselii]MCU9542941.1 DUF3150 domain-containing protein [Pseudomonas mosselii]MCU9548822.1 DUF3150 domain-containing protein [Pseudomonas mosselii]
MTDANVNNSVQVVAQTAETEVAVLNHQIKCISEDRQIDMKDIDVVVGELSPQARKLLCEKIFPKDFLRPYHRIREQAEEVLDKLGSIKTDLGGVNTIASAVEKTEELDALEEKWNELKMKDKDRYTQMCQEHLVALGAKAIKEGADQKTVAKLTSALVKRQPTWEEVERNITFAYSVHIIQLDDQNFNAKLYKAQRDSVVALREGVMGACVQHICSEALAIWKLIDSKDRTTSTGQIKLNPRTVRRARAMTEKLAPLAFIHPLIQPLSEILKGILDKLPESGHMSSGEFSNFENCLLALKDQRKVVDHLKNGTLLVSVTAQPQAALSSASAPQGVAANTTAQGNVAQQQTAPTAPAVVSTSAEVATAASPVEEPTTPVVVAEAVAAEQEESVPAVDSSVPAQDVGITGALDFYM